MTNEIKNEYPKFSVRMENEVKDYPTLSTINLGESIDERLDVQGSKIHNEQIPKDIIYFNIKDSDNPMYDQNYDSDKAKVYSNPIQNPPIQPNYYNRNNAPDFNKVSSNDQMYDQRYDAQNSNIYQQDIPRNEYNPPSMAYDSKKYNKDINPNYNYLQPQTMNQYLQPSSAPYDYVQPHGPGMFPPYPPRFPHGPNFPHHLNYPNGNYPYEGNYYAYC